MSGFLPFPVPSVDAPRIDWDAVFASPFGAVLRPLAGVPQNPAWHAEGDVLVHTRLVAEALAADPDFLALPAPAREALFAAALLHDIGKASKTRLENGVWTSPGHSLASSLAARKFLWQALDLAGTPEKRAFRETVCMLLRHHPRPLRLLDRPDPERYVLSLAAEGCLVPGYTLRLLALLARADFLGRRAPDIAPRLDAIGLFADTARELGCLDAPPAFPTPFARLAWIEGRTRLPSQPLHDDTWGTVCMVCGLPGTGKDTWIRRRRPGLPAVSLDGIRAELGLSWRGDQAPVVACALERAREHLRSKRPFVWNATSLTPALRERPIRLFRDYRAFVEIVVLETPWNEGLRRNRARPAAVPEDTLDAMLARFSPPTVREAHDVAAEFC